MDIILKFEDNNIQYYVVKENDEIKYCFIENGEKKYNLNEEQEKLVNTVISKILPSNDKIKTMEYTLNGKKYDVYIDKKNYFHTFFPMPSNEELIKLNFLFNNMEEHIANEGQQTYYNDHLSPYEPEETDFIKRIVKIGQKSVKVLLAGGIIGISYLLLFVNSYKFISNNIEEPAEELQYQQEIVYTQSLSDEEYLKEIEKAINSNTNLSDEEKKVYLANPSMYLDTKENTSIAHLKEILTTVDFQYLPLSEKNYYYPSSNIIVFSAEDFSSVPTKIINHEVSHSITKYLENRTEVLCETVNTIYSMEYLDSLSQEFVNDSMDYPYNCVKALIEILGYDCFKQYHSINDDNLIISELCSIISNKDKAYTLIDNLNNYRDIEFYSLSDPELDENSKKELITNLEKIRTRVYALIDEYCYAKNGTHVDDNPIILYYLDQDQFYKKLVIDNLPEGYELFEINEVSSDNQIAYFNSKLKNENMKIISHVVATVSCINKDTGEKMYFVKEMEFITIKEYSVLCDDIHIIEDLFDYEHGKEQWMPDFYRPEYLRALIEIIGTFPVKEAYENKSFEPILQSLINLNGSEKDAKELVKLLNMKALDESSTAKIYDYMKEYYCDKYNANLEDDLMMLLYLNKPLFEKEILSMYNLSDTYIGCDTSTLSTKKYFDKEGQNNKITIELFGRSNVDQEEIYPENEFGILTIDDSNRYLNNGILHIK